MASLHLNPNGRWPTGLLLVMLLSAAAAGADSLTIVNSADYSAVVAPGSLITIFGSGLSGTTRRAESLPLPLVLDGVEVKAGGRAIPLLFVSPGQINAQLPPDVASGILTISIGGASGTARVQPTAPGLFRFGGELAWPNEVMPGGQLPYTGRGSGRLPRRFGRETPHPPRRWRSPHPRSRPASAAKVPALCSPG